MHSSAIRAVLFDFDGTLIDSFEAIAASVNHVRAGHGLPPLDEPLVRRHVGRGLAYLLEKTVPGADVEADAARYRAHHPSVMRSLTRPLPGAREALVALKHAGLAIAVCSNKPVVFTRELLGHLGLAPHVDVVLGPEDVAQPKPAPDMLVEALARLKVRADEAIYVGDMAIDVEVAHGAGVRVFVVPTGTDDRETLAAARPDRMLESLDELRGLVTAP